MTQSAIEHFENDLIFFKQIRDYVLSYRGSVIQVHLLPSSSCLRLYLFHGIRQYTPRTVSKILKLFKSFSYTLLFRLGGVECNRVHYEFITKPLILQRIGDLRNLRIQEYDRKVFKAMGQDMKTPQRSPAFYALLIHSNAINKLL